VLAVSRLTGTLAMAIGRASWTFWLNLTGLVVYVPAFLVGVQFGLNGVAVAFGVGTLAMTVPEFRIAMHGLDLSLWPVVKPVVPVAAATAAMALVAAVSISLLRSAPDAVALAVSVVLGGATNVLVLWRAAPDLIAEGLRLVRRRRAVAA
jgi:PST family polysaccharide transporter